MNSNPFYGAKTLHACADRAAAKLCRRYQGSLLEQEDVRQELLLDLLTRLNSFDAERSSLPTFINICFGHKSSRLVMAMVRDRQARHPVSLDAPLPGSSDLTFADTVAEDESYGAWIGQLVDDIAQVERRIDLDRLLSALPSDARSLCAALMQDGFNPEITAGLSRTTLHRRKHDLRCRLLAAGADRHVEQTTKSVGI